MSVYFVEGVSSQGRKTVLWVPAVAVRAAATVAELTATGALAIQMALRPGSLSATSETTRVDDPRLGALITYEAFGTTKVTLGDATFIDRPQDIPGAATAKHIDLIVDGAAGFIVVRRGLGSAPENWQAIAVAQRYILYPCTAGPRTEIDGDDAAGGQFEYTQPFIVTGPRVRGVVAT